MLDCCLADAAVILRIINRGSKMTPVELEGSRSDETRRVPCKPHAPAEEIYGTKVVSRETLAIPFSAVHRCMSLLPFRFIRRGLSAEWEVWVLVRALGHSQRRARADQMGGRLANRLQMLLLSPHAQWCFGTMPWVLRGWPSQLRPRRRSFAIVPVPAA